MLFATQKLDVRYLSLLLFAITFFVAPRVLAQSKITADKSMDVSVFGGYLFTDPDIGRRSDRGNGISVGADVTRYFGWRVAPSLEVRSNYAAAPFASESTALVGLRLKTDLRRRFHPYADFLIGGGRIAFTNPPAPGYKSDKSLVYDLGGGMDIDVHRNFAAKVDFQGQSWDMGISPSVTGSQTKRFTLVPVGLMVGVTYRIPFRPYNRQSDVPQH
jgi:opacity protein-like surface antigen